MTKVHIMSNGSPEENLRQLFRILDIDNNRTVSISEFKKVVTDLQMMSENDNNMDNSIRDLIVEKAFIEIPFRFCETFVFILDNFLSQLIIFLFSTDPLLEIFQDISI